MIELRWVDRKVKDLHPLVNVAYGHPREKVLQFRQEEECLSGMTGQPFKLWSDWQDVPTVREE